MLLPKIALSAVHRGVAFEERSLRLLQDCLSMSLRRVGGKADGGIDLQGWWWLPTDDSSLQIQSGIPGHRRLRVLAQCKAEAKKMSPKYIREMEGVLLRYTSVTPSAENTFQGPGNAFPVVGLVVSSSSFSKSAALQAHSSPLPLALMHIPEHDSKETETMHPASEETPGFIAFNPALASRDGVLRGQFEARWEYQAYSPSEGRLGLWWKGTRVQSWTPDIEEINL